MIKFDLVLVEWIDAYGCSSIWNPIPPKSAPIHICFSVGWLVKEDKDMIVIVPHVSPENDEIDTSDQGCGDMAIPKSAIKKRVVLRKAKKK